LLFLTSKRRFVLIICEGAAAMNEQYLKMQAERIRSLAAAADPFTSKRLLDLARHYDERLKGRSSRHVSFLANLPERRPPETIQR
jgi:hypothetical protein